MNGGFEHKLHYLPPNLLLKRINRSSPQISSSENHLGFIATGNDGRQYRVYQNKHGVHRWVLEQS